MSRVLLTGASGFLGGHLLAALRADGCQVRALSRRPQTDASLAAAGVEPVRGDLADGASLARAVSGCEAVFHAAADTSLWRPHDAAQHAVNVDGTQRLLDAAARAGVGAFMHTSSVAAWSHRVEGVIDESVPQRGGDSRIGYERSKYLGEQRVRTAPLPWIVFNPAHILGPGDYRNWTRLIVMIDRGRLPGIPPGRGVFADVREVAAAQVRAWRRGRFGQRYLLGGAEATFVELVQAVGASLQKAVPQRPTPAWLLAAVAQVADWGGRLRGREPDMTPAAAALVCQRMQVDSTKARAELDYRCTPLPLLLQATLAWMRAEGLLRVRR